MMLAEVAVNNVAIVRGLEGFGNLPGDVQCFTDGNRTTLQSRLERLAFNKLHHDRAHPAGLDDAIDVRNVGMIQQRQHLSFALKTRQPFRIAGKGFG
jgi:hypothetical protein